MRAKSWLIIAIAIVSSMIVSGCATQRVTTEGFLVTPAKKEISKNGTFAILTNPKADNLALDSQIALKINKIISSLGYKIAPQENADFIVETTYGIEGHKETVLIPEWEFPYDYPFYVRGIGGYDPFYYDDFGWEVTVPETYQYYTSKIMIKVKDASHYLEHDRNSVVWVGTAYVENLHRDLRSSIDYLLAAAFQSFGKDTGKSNTLWIKRKNPIVEVLECSS